VCAAMLSAPQPDPTSAPWLTTFTVMSGVLVTALFALLAAVYLAWEAKEGPLARDFQKRALISLASVVILLAVDVALARTAAPAMLAGIRDKPISVGAIVLGGVSVLGLVMSLHASAFRAARLCVVGFGSAFVIGWGSQRHPYLIEPAWTLTSAASMPATQKMLIVTSIGGACFLVPSLVFLFRVFKAKPAAENEASHD